MKTLRLLNVLVILMLILLFGGFAAGYEHYKKEIEEPVPWCGTTSYMDHFDDELTDMVKNGQALFKANCASCHVKNMRADMTGPALGGSFRRFNNDTMAYLSFVQNSGAYIAKGHDERIVQLFEDWDKSVMQAFPNLSKEDIKAIIAYTEAMYKAT